MNIHLPIFAGKSLKLRARALQLSQRRPALRLVRLLALAGSLAVAGCATPGSSGLSLSGSRSEAGSDPAIAPKIDSAKLAAEGIRYLQHGDEDRALRLFNAAIKFDPERGEYHLLAAIVYHLQFLGSGTHEMRDNAEIGYQLAARFSPRSPQPWIQLGWLHADAKQFARANLDFARAAELRPGNPDALYGLAMTGYLTGDLKTALWSTDELDKQRWDQPAVNRMRAVLLTAADQPEEALRYRNAYAEAEAVSKDTAGLKTFDDRLAQIRSTLDGQNWLTPPDRARPVQPGASKRAAVPAPSPAAIQLAQAEALAMPEADSAPMPAPPAAQPAAPAVPQAEPDRTRKAWYDCAVKSAPAFPGGFAAPAGFGAIAGPGQGGGFPMAAPAGMSITGEETSSLPALPAPCEGDPQPRMAVIDAVLLRTEDQVARSLGVNLLQGLTGFFGQFRNTQTNTDGSTSVIKSNFVGIGGSMSTSSSAAPLFYALNIANATNNRNEVIARPSLLAIDRMPSTFFSGTTVSIAISGNAGSTSTLVDKQIGVSFSITPTIIDHDNVMLSVKAVRSFIEPPAPGTSGVALSTSRNSVTANITARFGETVILSGLTERELIRSDSGVPVLKDIPGVQYMFSNTGSTDFFRTVMIMITPRKPVTSDADMAAVEREKELRKTTGKSARKAYAFYWRIEEYEKVLAKYAPNLDATIETLESNELYKSFKSKDLVDTNWATKSRMDVLLHDIGQVLWH
ncbi:MAG: hypothetical protein NTX56_14635 [Proteobacteria bacterium]|nr:hypothetical protein [Pseudomonadota bacterium]